MLKYQRHAEENKQDYYTELELYVKHVLSFGKETGPKWKKLPDLRELWGMELIEMFSVEI